MVGVVVVSVHTHLKIWSSLVVTSTFGSWFLAVILLGRWSDYNPIRSKSKLFQVLSLKAAVDFSPWIAVNKISIVLLLKNWLLQWNLDLKWKLNVTNLYSQLLPCGHPAIVDTRYYRQNSDPHLQRFEWKMTPGMPVTIPDTKLSPKGVHYDESWLNLMKSLKQRIFFPVIEKYMEKNLSITEPCYSEYILPLCTTFLCNILVPLYCGGRQGGLKLPPPVPFTPASHSFRRGSRLFVLFLLWNVMQHCEIFLLFSRFPPLWESRFPPFGSTVLSRQLQKIQQSTKGSFCQTWTQAVLIFTGADPAGGGGGI